MGKKDARVMKSTGKSVSQTRAANKHISKQSKKYDFLHDIYMTSKFL